MVVIGIDPGQSGAVNLKTPPSKTLDAMKSSLRYEDGRVFWAAKRRKAVVGAEAGSKGTHYRTIMFDGKNYFTHRIVWLLCTGHWPEGFLDHIDRDKGNNRIENLRLATKSQNGINHWPRRNKTGYTGVILSRGVRYVARIKVNGKEIHLGVFSDAKNAASARKEAEKKYFGEFAVEGIR